jgi:UDP-glucuronate 4-epimerase
VKILVTGAAGFIGSHLTESLVKIGHQVIAVDALVPELYSIERKKKNWDGLESLGTSVTRYQLDLRSTLIPPEITDCEYIFHLAAMPGLSLSWENTKLYIDCNVLATSNLLKACNLSRLKRFFYVSTSSVYGQKIDGDELSRISPISPYGVTKLASENMVSAFSRATGMPYTIFRPFSVYGPRQRDDMAFNIFIDKISKNQEIQIFGNGSQTRTNTYVTDLVEGLIAAITEDTEGEIYNLSGLEQFNVLDIVTIIGELLNKQPILNFKGERLGDQQLTKNISKKANLHFGYSPATRIKEGLQRQINWQLSDT